jgi:transposase
MEKKLFIGIDFSKKKLDVSLFHSDDLKQISRQCFENSRDGCLSLLQWIKSQTHFPLESWLFCGEHTGLYSVLLCEFLLKKGLFIRMENPLQIKQSTGIKRDKNDKIDSRDIAPYAYRFRDKARSYQLPDKDLKALELLLSFRERLMSNKHTLTVSAKEIRAVLQRNSTARYIYEQSQKDIARINKEIKEVEKQMLSLITENEAILENYEPVSSIKGIALINTVAILVATQNFTRFENSRRFACYAGMAPFGKQSGSSIRTQPHVCHLANKKIKVLLTLAAQSAIRHDPNIRHYFERKQEEGKKNRLIINNIRNKLIHRIFAVVRNNQLYQVDFLNPLCKTVA